MILNRLFVRMINGYRRSSGIATIYLSPWAATFLFFAFCGEVCAFAAFANEVARPHVCIAFHSSRQVLRV